MADGCVPGQFPRSFWEQDRWLNPPEDFLVAQCIDENIKHEYCNYDRLPSFMKAQVYVRHPMEVLISRCVKSNLPLPSGTVMARYTQQHSLQGDILGSLRRIGEDIT